MIYRRLLCDFCRRCRGMASMAVRCVGHRLSGSSHYQSNSSSNLSRCDMSLTFHFLVYSFSVFQCLILACRQLFSPGNLSFSRIELNIIQLRSTRGSNFDFGIFKKNIFGCASRPHPVCTSGCCGAKQVT